MALLMSPCARCGETRRDLTADGLCEDCSPAAEEKRRVRAHARTLILARELDELASELEATMPSRGLLGVQIAETDIGPRLEPLIARVRSGVLAHRLPGLAERLRRSQPSRGFLGVQLGETDIADELAGIVRVVRDAASVERRRADELAPALSFMG